MLQSSNSLLSVVRHFQRSVTSISRIPERFSRRSRQLWSLSGCQATRKTSFSNTSTHQFNYSIRSFHPERGSKNFLESSSNKERTYINTNHNLKMSTAAVTEAAGAEKPFQRLPLNAIPTHYSLTIIPKFEDFTFEGFECIEINLTEDSNEILLNSSELTIAKAIWKNSSGQEVNASTIQTDEAAEVASLKFNPALAKGSGTLHLEFTGSINDKMKGFYRSKYKGADGKDKYNGVTQFEATDARKCFPCWDEPSHKATFDISLIVEKDKVALSNMPIKETTAYLPNDKLHVVTYDRSPIMSTYLLAFVIGDFEYTETTSSDGVLCRVYTPPGKKEQGRFALDVTAKVLPYYKEYFGIAYPLPKLDLVAIADFSAGAMENWGLITYRESCLLIDEKESSATSRQWVALVVGHEAAHQWFGNLVTMEWWTHLWLNEGYASFVEFLCVDYLFPEFDIWTQFVTETYIRALELDCLKNSHPIEVPVGHPREIDEIFDDISYSKGAAIIRMLHRYIGDVDFRKGMTTYLKRHQYKNTFTEDLWRALEESSGKPVGEVMGTWTKQMGFPLIRVQSEQQGENRVMHLTQEKYWADPQLKSSREHQDYQWMIPLTFSSSSNPKVVIGETLMEEKTASISLPNIRSDEWVKVNPGAVGYYRVQYSPDLLLEFLPAIHKKILPPLDRLALLDDLYAMVQCGESSTTDVLKMLEAFKDEDNFTVWSSISNIVGKLNLLFAYTDYHSQYKAFGRHLFSAIEEKLGWEPKDNERHLDTMLRSLVLLRMTAFEHDRTIHEAKRRLDRHVSGEQSVPADLRSVVYKAVISGGNEETFNTMIKMYRESDMDEEKDRIGRALGASKNPDILKKVLDFSIGEHVRNQDSVFIIISAGMSKEGRDIAWSFFKNNRQLFQERYPGGGLISRLVKYIAENFVTEEAAVEVTQFFAENPFPGTERTVHQAVENIRLNEGWLKRDGGASLGQYLAKFSN